MGKTRRASSIKVDNKMTDRLIKFPERNSQIIDFAGLNRRRGITPTDIDGFIDYGGNAFIYFDAKIDGVPVSKGQRMAYENIVNSHRKAGNRAVAFIFRHNTPHEESVIASEGIVDEIYTTSGWEKRKDRQTVIELIEEIERVWDKAGIKL